MFDMSDSGVVDEFEAVLDAKLKRWRFCKLECVRQLQKALERTQIAYNQSDLMHEQMLSQLWYLVPFLTPILYTLFNASTIGKQSFQKSP